MRDTDDEPAAPAGRVVLASAPKIRAVYWCRFWRDALRPEFFKNRPCARLAQMDGGVPRMKPQDFDQVVKLMLRALPEAPAAVLRLVFACFRLRLGLYEN